MDWYAVNVKQTTGLDWLAIDPALRGHWHALMSVCAQRENGGVLRGARAWDARAWDRLAAVTPHELEQLVAMQLVRWEGDDLAVVGYDVEREQRYQDGREQRKRAGEASAAARRERAVQRSAERPAERDAERSAERPVERAVDSERPVGRPVERAVERPAEQKREDLDQKRSEENPLERPVERPVQRQKPRDPMGDFNAGRQMLERLVAVVNRVQGEQYDASEQQFHVVNAVRAVFEKHGEQDVLAAVEWKLVNRRGGKRPELRWIVADLPNTVVEWKNRRNGTAAPGGRTDFAEGDRA